MGKRGRGGVKMEGDEGRKVWDDGGEGGHKLSLQY